MTRQTLATLAMLTALVVGSPAQAQDARPSVSATPQQLELNDAGVQAMIDGDMEKAISLFNESLAAGELNVTYLNLGRANAKLTRCDEAVSAYARVLTSPVVDSPDESQVLEVLDRYKSELHGDCGGTLVLSCPAEEVTIVIDKGEEQPCSPEPILLLQGSHEIVTTYLGNSESQDVDIAKGQQSATEIVTPTELTLDDLQANPWFWSGVGVGSLGAVLFLTAIYTDLFVLGPDIEDYEQAGADGDTRTYDRLRGEIDSTQSTVTALYITGALLTAAGATLVFYPPEKWGIFDNAQAWVTPNAGGVQVLFSW